MKERATRHPRRVQVRFWQEDDPSNSYVGYTRNISATGIFIATVHPVKPGEVLGIEFHGDDYDFRVRGQVVHSAKVSALLQSVRPSGMGVKFLDRSIELEKLLPADQAGAQGEQDQRVFPMYFPSAEELIEVYERDVKNGGLFVPTSRPAGMEEDVTIELHLPRPEDPVLTFDAKVVHLVGSGPSTGMGIAFLDQDEVISRLSPVIASLR